jgi:hypothetical protein
MHSSLGKRKYLGYLRQYVLAQPKRQNDCYQLDAQHYQFFPRQYLFDVFST